MASFEVDSLEGYTLFCATLGVIVMIFVAFFQVQSESQPLSYLEAMVHHSPNSSMPRVSSRSTIISIEDDDDDEMPLNLKIAFRNDRGGSYGAITRYENRSLIALEEEYLREYQEIRDGQLSAGGEASAHTPVAEGRTTTEGCDFSQSDNTTSPSAIDAFSMGGNITPLMGSGEGEEMNSPATVRYHGTGRYPSGGSAIGIESGGKHSSNGRGWDKMGRVSLGDGFLSRGVLRMLKSLPIPRARDKEKDTAVLLQDI